MVTTSVFLHSPTSPFGSSSYQNPKSSHRHFIKHIKLHSPQRVRSSYSNFETRIPPIQTTKIHLFSPLSSTTSTRRRTPFSNQPKSSYSNTEVENPFTKSFRNLNFTQLEEKLKTLKTTLSQVTPLDVCKWSGVVCILIAATKWTVSAALNPFIWMYISWTWLFWPWLVAIALAVYGFYCLKKHSLGEANIVEQLAIVTSAFTWLTLVPPAHFNGFLEGWPYVFFFVYHYFFFFSVSVRKRLYGDYYAREHDPKWDIVVPNSYRALFCAGALVGHFLAAFEGPELHLIPGGWSNLGVWVLIMMTLFMQYHSTLYLAKYSEKVVVPTAVVQFGPYRWVRHPIYASVMLLFVTYCVALRAPLSSLFLVAVCVLYYEQKAKLEEALMMETFGEAYSKYMSKVRYKFIPFLY